MFSIRRRNVEHVFKYLNECMQITIDKHDFTIHYKKNLHNIK